MRVLVADFGGTRIKSGLVEDGRLLSVHIHDTPGGRTLEPQLPELRRLFGKLGGDVPPEAMIWALPCIVAPDRRTVTRTFGKFEDAPDLDLSGWVEHHFGIPLLLENDARAAAIGEWFQGAGQGCLDMVMVTLGTGIGTAVIIGGRPLYGDTGMAGNLGGHDVIHVGGRECTCGQRGCAEAHVATWALPGIARESPLFPASSLADSERLDYREVFAQAASGDALARELKASAIRDWTAVLANLIPQFDPERVVIGGGIMEGKEEILPLLEESLWQALPHSRKVRLYATALGEFAALFGGAVLWKERATSFTL